MADAFTYTAHNGLPELVYASPYCSHCHTDVEIEDGVAYCNNCLLQWDAIDDGVISVFDGEAEREPCGLLPDSGPQRTYYHGGKRYEFSPYHPCILPDGHSKQHLHPYEVTTTIIPEETS